MLKDILEQWNGTPVTPMEVYTDIFHLGENYLQRCDEETSNLKANALGYWKNESDNKGHYRIMFDDTFEETLQELQQADFSIINGITYFGRRNSQEHASKMYAMIFDLDGVTDKTLNAFLSGCFADGWKVYPLPNYIALSGHGVHLYYVFEEPIPLYPNIKLQLKNFKYALTDKIWNGYTSTIDARQYQGINQGFRPIGGKTKIEGVTVQAYKFNTHPFSLSQLGEYIAEEYRIDESKLFKESKTSLEQAKELYPQWYEKVVLGKDRKIKKWDIAEKVNGKNPYALYDWWKRQIETGASYHHRYFAIMCLVIYGVKNGVPKAQVKKDAYSFIPMMNAIEPTQAFTKADCDSAMDCFDDKYCTFPIDDICKLSAIEIKKNKRNGRKQADHIKIMNFVRDEINQNKDWHGRKPLNKIVEQWQLEHPTGRKADCIRDTGLSKPTVYKYWH